MSCPCKDCGLGAVTNKPVHRGAPFSLGVEISHGWYTNSGIPIPSPTSIDANGIALDLMQSGYVEGYANVYQLSGWLNPFIVIEGYSGREYGSDLHLKDAVLSVLSNTYAVDESTVRFEAQVYDPETGAAAVSRYDAPTGGSAGAAPREAGGSSPIDTLANWLGVSPTNAALIGAGGALLLLLVLKR